VLFRERREATREKLGGWAKLQLRTGALPRDCRLIDISEKGLRIHAEGLDLAGEFVIFLPGSERPRPCRVIWRIGDEIGAQFLDTRFANVRRPGAA
jgi:hypothetical protein